MAVSPTFVGIDVSKATLEVALRPSGERESGPNDESGIKRLISRLRELEPALIVVESTGGFERQLTRALVSAELPVVVVNPRQVRDFAKATGQLAKTDTIDAMVLARFAEAVRPAVRPLPDATLLELQALIARRRQLTEMIVAERNRFTAASKTVRKPYRCSHRLAGSRAWACRQRSRSKHPSKPHLARDRRIASKRAGDRSYY